MNKDRITGIVGLIFCMFFAWQATIIRKIPNAVEPGPKMMPILAISIIVICCIGLILTGKANTKSYFPSGGIKKIIIGFLSLLIYGFSLSIIGFKIATPFAMIGFIYLLKGEHKVNPIIAIINGIAVSTFLYLIFVVGFSIQLPTGILF
ncbi:tripartite tricarboxylate transporter TctB family protein [Fusobacterium sp. PH5-44]|uniref:tripartite tricarboxylate transporter TctB family protein n=1 Tax=unclassified Fusobacterium TaxID=2648384 RepID=UPI003D1CDC59